MNRSPEQRTILAIYTSFKAYIKYNKKHLLKYTLIPRSDFFYQPACSQVCKMIASCLIISLLFYTLILTSLFSSPLIYIFLVVDCSCSKRNAKISYTRLFPYQI